MPEVGKPVLITAATVGQTGRTEPFAGRGGSKKK